MDICPRTKRRQGIWPALFLLAAVCCSAAYAEVIYRWVDDNGLTHFTDKAPRQPAKSVTTIDTHQYELSPAQRKDAEARIAREKARAAELASGKEKEAPAPAPAIPMPQAGNPPAKPSPAATDCASLLQRFWDSAECYAPFLNVNGSMKPGGPETCGPPVPYPAKECS